jgi:hypothetical protein
MVVLVCMLFIYYIRKKVDLKKENSDMMKKIPSKISDFAGYNKNESTLRPKSPLTPKFSVKKSDLIAANVMKLIQSDIITTERNILSNSISETDNFPREVNLNNTISQFNI